MSSKSKMKQVAKEKLMGVQNNNNNSNSSLIKKEKESKSIRKGSIDSFFTKKDNRGDKLNRDNDDDSINAINNSIHNNNNNQHSTNNSNNSKYISMTQEEGFRVLWKTSPGRRNSSNILRESKFGSRYNRNNGVFGNSTLGSTEAAVDVQNEVNMIDDVWKSLRSHDPPESDERVKKRRRHGVELSTSPRVNGAMPHLMDALSSNILIRQGKNKIGNSNNDVSDDDDEFLKPRSRLLEKMKAIHRVNQAKRIKRKRKETYEKFKTNNKGIGVRTSVSRLSSRVNLDDLFSDSDDEDDAVTGRTDDNQRPYCAQADEDTADMKDVDDTVLINSQPEDNDNKNCDNTKNVSAITSTIPSPPRPVARGNVTKDVKNINNGTSSLAKTTENQQNMDPIVRQREKIGIVLNTTSIPKNDNQIISNNKTKPCQNSSSNSIIKDDDEWALRAMELTLLKQQQQKVQKKPQVAKHNGTNTRTHIPVGYEVTSTQTHVAVAQESLSRPLPLHSMSNSKQMYTRFKVTSRVTCSNKEKRFAVKPDKRFVPSNVVEDPFALPLIVRLRGFWISTEVEERDSINIIWDPWVLHNERNNNNNNNSNTSNNNKRVVQNLKEAMDLNEIIVDNDSHWIILRPDVLISPSVVGTASKCLRQAIISSKLRDSASSKICTLGNLKHDLFEHAILGGNLTTGYLRNVSTDIIRKRAQECYASGLTDAEVSNELEAFIPKLKRWASIIMRRKHTNHDTKKTNGIEIMDTTGSSLTFSIDNILATEEDILSPMWGLRARPDASAVVNINYQQQNMNQNLQHDIKSDIKSGKYVSPLELKTGNPHQSHQAQALLYARAFMDRYGGDASAIGPPPYGTSSLKPSLSASNAYNSTKTLNGAMLIYLGLRDGNEDKEKVVYVREKRLELQALFGLRNNLARSMSENGRGVVNLALPLGKNESKVIKPPLPASRPLPGVIGRKSTCDMCYVRDVCALYHKCWENGTEETAQIGSAFNEAVGHLSECHMEYYRKWDRLLDLEDTHMHHSSKMLWRVPASERQARGTCAANLFLSRKERHSNLNNSITFDYTFCRKAEDLSPAQSASRSNSFGYSPLRSNNFSEHYNKRLENTFSVGDTVVISVDTSHVALGRAIVLFVDRKTVVVSSKIPLAIPSSLNDLLQNSHDSNGNNKNGITNMHTNAQNQVLWCLDKDIYESGMKSARQNIRRMLIGPPPISTYKRKILEKDPKQLALRSELTLRAERLRMLIVDGKKPEFTNNWKREYQLQNTSIWATPNQAVGGCETEALLKDFKALNDDQIEALKMCLNANDYAMVLGMPGTGKTTLIALLVRSLLNQGKRVLLSSFTNSAVDNMLLKLRKDGVDFVRVGNEKSVHPHIRRYTPQLLLASSSNNANNDINNNNNIGAVEQVIENANLIGTTCLSCGSGLMQQLRFDVCIVDEASQITEATCLGPLHLADKFILVGDHNQLNAVVKNKNAKKEGLATSLFKRLAELHPESICQLTYQYRMNKEIMSLANCLVYDEKLKCGSSNVANRQLQIPGAILSNPKILPFPKLHKEIRKNGHWLRDILRPDKPVIFVDTDGIGVPSLEKRTDVRVLSPDLTNSSNGKNSISGSNFSKGGLVNRVEASLVDTCIAGLLRCRIPLQDIGVICPYRSQLKVLKSSPILGKYGEDLEVQTVDKYQGRDKPCIIVSLVRSNEKSIVGELLRDWRRINVAFTRAMCKLIIFGSYKTLRGSNEKHILTFMSKVKKSGWRYQLQKQAHRFYRHYFENSIVRAQNNKLTIQDNSQRTNKNRDEKDYTKNMLSKENHNTHQQDISNGVKDDTVFVNQNNGPTRIIANMSSTKIIRKEHKPGSVMYEIEQESNVYIKK